MRAEIAIIGGSGVYSVEALKGASTTVVSTPYGNSPEITIGRLGGRRVAFLPRHGKGHTVPPHLVNYRANIRALSELRVKRVLATTACGSLNPRMRPGELALIYQFIDFTKRRPQTFYEGGEGGVVHVDVTEPYCPELRDVLLESARGLKLKLHPRATYGCTEGPRFETAAEVRALRRLGCDLVGMTNVTNFAAGISKAKLTHTEVAELMKENIGRVQKLLFKAIPRMSKKRSCTCAHALEGTAVRA